MFDAAINEAQATQLEKWLCAGAATFDESQLCC